MSDERDPASSPDEPTRRIDADAHADAPLDSEATHLSGATPVADSTAMPARIGNYRLGQVLGRGGMGIVFEAEQESPKRTVALKVIRGGQFVDPVAARLFEREAELLGRLEHPSIAQIYEAGRTDDGQSYFAMELVRGETLTAMAGPAPGRRLTRADLEKRLQVFARICDAVSFAHQRGVIHRDLKPANVIVGERVDNEGIPEVKVLDFGLAKLTDTDEVDGTILTQDGQLRGTVAYMSPEQIQGDPSAIDFRTDVYALGVVLYELLTGSRPYDTSNSIADSARMICYEPPKPLRAAWQGAHKLDRDLETIVTTAMAKEPERRYSSAAALASDVRRHLDLQPITARPASSAYVLRKLIQRNKLVSVVAATGLTLVVAFAVVMVFLFRESEANLRRALVAENEARTEATTANQVSEFLVDVFEVADPRGGMGKTVTAQELLERGTDQVRTRLSDQARVRGRLLGVLGEVHFGLGFFDEAIELQKESIEAMHADPETPLADLVNATISLASSLSHGSRGPEALERLDAVLAEVKAQDPVSEPLRARLAVARLAAANSASNHALAQTIVDENVDLVSRTFGESSAEMGTMLFERGSLRDRMGEDDGAIADFERAQEIWLSLDPPDELRAGDALQNLSGMHQKRGENAEGIALVEQALELWNRFYDGHHPRAILARSNLAILYLQDGRAEEGEHMLEEVRDLWALTRGTESDEYAQTLYNLGYMHLNQGKVDQAIAELESAYDLRVKLAGLESVPVAYVSFSLGTAYRLQERFDESLAMLELCLRIDERFMGPESEDVAWDLLEISMTQEAMGRSEEAAATKARAQEVFAKVRAAAEAEPTP